MPEESEREEVWKNRRRRYLEGRTKPGRLYDAMAEEFTPPWPWYSRTAAAEHLGVRPDWLDGLHKNSAVVRLAVHNWKGNRVYIYQRASIDALKQQMERT